MSHPSGLNSHYMRQREKKKNRMINVPSVWSVSFFGTHTGRGSDVYVLKH